MSSGYRGNNVHSQLPGEFFLLESYITFFGRRRLKSEALESLRTFLLNKKTVLGSVTEISCAFKNLEGTNQAGLYTILSI